MALTRQVDCPRDFAAVCGGRRVASLVQLFVAVDELGMSLREPREEVGSRAVFEVHDVGADHRQAFCGTRFDQALDERRP